MTISVLSAAAGDGARLVPPVPRNAASTATNNREAVRGIGEILPRGSPSTLSAQKRIRGGQRSGAGGPSRPTAPAPSAVGAQQVVARRAGCVALPVRRASAPRLYRCAARAALSSALQIHYIRRVCPLPDGDTSIRPCAPG